MRWGICHHVAFKSTPITQSWIALNLLDPHTTFTHTEMHLVEFSWHQTINWSMMGPKKRKEKPKWYNLTSIWVRWPYNVQESPWCRVMGPTSFIHNLMTWPNETISKDFQKCNHGMPKKPKISCKHFQIHTPQGKLTSLLVLFLTLWENKVLHHLDQNNRNALSFVSR